MPSGRKKKNVELKWKGQNEIFPNPCLVTVQPKHLLTKPELCKGFMLRDQTLESCYLLCGDLSQKDIIHWASPWQKPVYNRNKVFDRRRSVRSSVRPSMMKMITASTFLSDSNFRHFAMKCSFLWRCLQNIDASDNDSKVLRHS